MRGGWKPRFSRLRKQEKCLSVGDGRKKNIEAAVADGSWGKSHYAMEMKRKWSRYGVDEKERIKLLQWVKKEDRVAVASESQKKIRCSW